jgi:hypothetical protein
MRPPKGRATTDPGPAVAELEHCRARRMHLDFYDPSGEVYGLPTYPYKMAPPGLATYRQLRKLGLRPGGQEIQAQVAWWHGGGTRNGRSCRLRRVAYLYRVDLALPVRPMTPAMWRSHCRAMLARMTCPSCGIVQSYCIPRSLGECNGCHDSARAA